ncbi:hypothetical protein [Herbaspirillum sp. RV1423]|uniref:hypothetical protein n=1 Tax=Herbaspirillum sp. RV1423 TaxID=1443993 RepID=UPI0004BB3D08|nr:hypothetical protein [Herbaspirillum sp. RV1423]
MQLFFERIRRQSVAALVFAAAGLALLLPAVAIAEPARYGSPDKPPFNERYPSGSIHSVDYADEVLAEADKERTIIEDQYIDEQRGCYKKFFVSSCLEDAKERNRVAVKQVRDVEVEANAYKRQAKADDRDKALAEQRAKDEQDVARRAKEQQERDAAAVRKIRESTVKEQQVKDRERQTEGQADLRVKSHEAQLRKTEAEEAAKAPQRSANERAYKEKVKEAEAHRKDVEEKKAEKARERAAKQQQAPAAAGQTPATPETAQPK